MRKFEVGNCTLWNCDCMDGMKKIQDKYFDLAIVDPPYGINASNYSRGGTKRGKSKARCAIYTKKDWDKSTPDQSYFNELFRISKNQIIWGANYFIEKIQRSSNCWIVWDKDNGENRYADCELAWTNFSTAVRKYRYRWHGMFQENMKNKEDRIHPTQKPVALYRWILEKYAKKGDRIIDTHVGSASSFLACIQYGCEITGFEIDEEYYNNACERISKAVAEEENKFPEVRELKQEVMF